MKDQNGVPVVKCKGKALSFKDKKGVCGALMDHVLMISHHGRQRKGLVQPPEQDACDPQDICSGRRSGQRDLPGKEKDGQ